MLVTGIINGLLKYCFLPRFFGMTNQGQLEKPITPAKAGVQLLSISLILLDSGFRRNDASEVFRGALRGFHRPITPHHSNDAALAYPCHRFGFRPASLAPLKIP